MKNCMAEHTECISMDILRREAEETLDPDDPMIEMYSKKKTTEENTKENEEEAEKLIRKQEDDRKEKDRRLRELRRKWEEHMDSMREYLSGMLVKMEKAEASWTLKMRRRRNRP